MKINFAVRYNFRNFAKKYAISSFPMTTLINRYDSEREREYVELVEKSVEGLPFTIGHPLAQLYVTVEQGSYAKAKDYILELFELSAQYISIVLLAMLREGGVTSQQLVNVVQKIDNKRPLSFGDWCNDILPPLTATALEAMPDAPLSRSLCNYTTSKKNIFIGGKNEMSIVALRNQYKGHGTMLTDEKYHEVVALLEPRLMQLLEAMAPLCESTTLTQEGHCWMEGGIGIDKMDLYPLVFADSNNYIYLFQSLNDEKAYYVSANEQAESLLTTNYNPDIDAFFQSFVPAFDIAKRRNWTEWKRMLHAESNRFLQNVYREKRYNREMFVEREELTSRLAEFLSSGATLFPLPGEAGQGKTSQLCFWGEQIVANSRFAGGDNTGVLLLSGAGLSGTSLEAYLRQVFDLSPRKKITKVLDELHEAAENDGACMLILVDALNECENYLSMNREEENTNASEGSAAALLQDLLALFVGEKYTRFKLLFTCRNYTWNQILKPLTSDLPESFFYTPKGDNATVVRGFNDDELGRAYAVYSDFYSIHTPLSSLSRTLAIRLKDPLVLKIACINYLGTSMPDQTASLTSLALWGQLYENIHNAYAGSRQVEILDLVTETILDGYIGGKAENSVSVPELYKAYDDRHHPLHRLAKLVFMRQNDKYAITIAFAELINRPERPVLRYAEEDKIQFVYERFLEYMLALAIRKSESHSVDNLVSFLSRVNPDEVMLGALRNLLIMDYVESGDSTTIRTLIAQQSDNLLMMNVLTDVMNVLVRENYEKELFNIEKDLVLRFPELDTDKGDIQSVITEFNKLSKLIATNKGTAEVISRFNGLHVQLMPLIHMRTMAIQTLLGGIFLTDYFNEELYRTDPFELLWMLTDDPLVEVKDAVCLQSYYVTHQHITIGGTPIKKNLSELIASRMFDWLDGRSLPRLFVTGNSRRRTITFLETATRLLVMLIIDVLLTGDQSEQQRVPQMLDRLRATVRHLTLNHVLIRIILPALNIVMRRQLTFQSDYVNNAIEYQRFWTAIPDSGDWCRSDLPEIMQHIYQYSRYYAKSNASDAPDFAKYADKIYAAYRTGDSLSYFVLERLLVINGVCSWQSVEPLLTRFDSEFCSGETDGGNIRDTQWWDYSQMSIIYVLYQLGMKMPEMPEQVFDMLGRWCVDWTRRLKGLFVAPNSHIANPRQKYKRNVMTWYAMVYAYRNGDRRRQPYQSAPLFYELIDEAVANDDGELLAHMLDNISELVSDSGYIHTALDLMSHILSNVSSNALVEVVNSRLATFLSTAKSYAPAEINTFLTNEMPHFQFPGVANYRDEILNYTPCGEKLSDLLTHRFGNFVIYALIHQEPVDDFCYNAAQYVDKTKDFSDWFAIVVRMLLRDLLKINIKVS